MRKQKLEELKALIETYEVLCMKQLNEENKFLSIKSFLCTLANGDVIRRERLLKNDRNGSSAVILPVMEDGNVILTVEPKVFTKRTVGVSVPAGYINRGEFPLLAAHRELMEETGYSVDKVVDLGSFYQDTGVSGALINYFLGFGAKKTGEPKFDYSEKVSTFICSYEEALDLIEMGYIEDINAIIALERSKKYLLR